ncbi:RNA polymerase sigma factor [Bowmanella dokdonensis]|uniref:RNA polymerase sigma factor n=1 Tax=Bowmanella dokdonensis TaxID=751969 RepID=A0A939DMG4_9ALTE|nr:RNA polymerase sigma factor [Bowmanella dokdonensis]MBN7825305.1 RNA polymerase sigma factor [Bowmanella dokdonensis]
MDKSACIAKVEDLYQRDSRKVFATLVRLLGDFELAEEAMHEAFAAALQQWPEQGLPHNPLAWLVSAGKFKALDGIRRKQKFGQLQPDLQRLAEELGEHQEYMAEQEIEDERLRLIFTCCHPAIDARIQVPLTLREVCGLTTEEIASAFLTQPATLAQRIVRGKAKIRDARIPFKIPELAELPARLDAVLSVIYLIFNEGYSASAGDAAIRRDLSDEAIRLTRLVLELLPDPEVMGLLALMLLHESRRAARTDENGDLVLLEDQDRSVWDRQMIEEGKQLVRRALATRRFGFYTLQAAISAVHADAASPQETDWHQIVALYSLLLQVEDSPIIALNRAVAVAMRDGPGAGLEIIDQLLRHKELAQYHLAYSARGELLRRSGQPQLARQAYAQALSLAKQAPERRFLQARLAELDA